MTRGKKIELLRAVQAGRRISEVMGGEQVGSLIVQLSNGMYYVPGHKGDKQMTQEQLESLISPEEIQKRTKIMFTDGVKGQQES